MKIIYFAEHHLYSYTDDQINVPLSGLGCENVQTLVESAIYSEPADLDFLRKLYFSLGYELGVGHISNLEAVLLLDLTDRRLFPVLSRILDRTEVPSDDFYTHEKWVEIRREYLFGKNHAERMVLKFPKRDLPGCPKLTRPVPSEALF